MNGDDRHVKIQETQIKGPPPQINQGTYTIESQTYLGCDSECLATIHKAIASAIGQRTLPCSSTIKKLLISAVADQVALKVAACGINKTCQDVLSAAARIAVTTYCTDHPDSDTFQAGVAALQYDPHILAGNPILETSKKVSLPTAGELNLLLIGHNSIQKNETKAFFLGTTMQTSFAADAAFVGPKAVASPQPEVQIKLVQVVQNMFLQGQDSDPPQTNQVSGMTDHKSAQSSVLSYQNLFSIADKITSIFADELNLDKKKQFNTHHQIKNVSQNQSAEDKQPDMDQSHRKLVAGGQAYCTYPLSSVNLCNTQALAELSNQQVQNGFFRGCDQDLIQIDRGIPTAASLAYVNSKLVDTNQVGSINVPVWWKVTFPFQTSIKTFLIINRDDAYLEFIKGFIVTFGNSADVTQNAVCTSAMPDGGWYMCPTSLSGITFGIYSTTNYITFMEVMVFSQEAIQLRSGVTMSFIGTEQSNYVASNSLQYVVIVNVERSGQRCITIAPPTGGFAILNIKFKAQVPIKVVVLVPGYYKTGNSDYPYFQSNVAISGQTVAGAYQLCGVLSNYYSEANGGSYEAPCNNVLANVISAKQQTQDQEFRLCGIGVLSDCDCSSSSFDPLQFTIDPAMLFVSATSISAKSTDSIQTIIFNTKIPDTISTICGAADGITNCGPRKITFKDQLQGLTISVWPFCGFQWDALTSVLSQNPAKAAPKCILNATLSLVNYPLAYLSQDITSTVLFPLTIPSQTLNVVINQEATLQLPIFTGVQYIVTGLPTFKATVVGSKLIIISLDNKDIGTQSLQMSASTLTETVTFTVKVVFKAQATTVAIAVTSTSTSKTTTVSTKITASTNTTESINATASANTTASTNTTATTTSATTTASISAPSVQTSASAILAAALTESTVLSASDSDKLLDTVQCQLDAQGNMSCGSGEGPQLFIDPATGQFVFVAPGKKTSETKSSAIKPPQQPILEISKVNNKGLISFKFSEPVGLEALEKPKKTQRLLKVSKPKAQAKQKEFTGDPTQLYLLSAKHLQLTIKSENTTQPHFSWHATNITSTEILIQVIFQDPLYISNQLGLLDRLMITILPPAIQYMRSLATGLLTENLLRTEIRDVPPQVILGAAIESAQAVSESLQEIGQSSTIGNVVVQILLSGSMGQMWSMVNSLQIILSYQLLEVQMPGNVIMVLTNLASVASFDVFPTDDIMSFLFNFTPTTAPGVGFAAMGNENKSLTLYLGSAFLIMILIGLQYLLYSLAYACRLYDKLLSKIEQKLKPGLIYGTIYLFLVETYLDWAIGSALRLEEPKFETPSDYFDFGLACVGILITLVLPCYCFFFLKRNVNLLDDEDFKSRHGAFYEGFITDNALKRQASMQMPAWFLLRRFLTAVNLLYLRNQTIWIQLATNMYLSLVDVCVKIHLSPYESKLAGFMEKFNDLFVLSCAYFPYLFTDLITSQEDKYFIGWFYSGIIGMLLASNLFVMLMTAFIDMKEKISEMVNKCRLKKETQANNARREEQEAASKKVQSNTVDGVIVAVVKPKATELQNGICLDQQELLEQYKAFKRLERKAKRDAAIAYTKYCEAKLIVIPEVSEEEVTDIEPQVRSQAARKQVLEGRVPLIETSSSQASSSQISSEKSQLSQVENQIRISDARRDEQERIHQNQWLDEMERNRNLARHEALRKEIEAEEPEREWSSNSKFYWLSVKEEKSEVARMKMWLREQNIMTEKEKVVAERKYIESAVERKNFGIIYNKHKQEKAREAEESRMIQQNEQSQTLRQVQDERRRQLQKASKELHQLYEQEF